MVGKVKMASAGDMNQIADFDAHKQTTWFVGRMNRVEAQDKLQHQSAGVFLVRESVTSRGDFVLCVSENNKISHYIINRSPDNKFKIGDLFFESLPELIEFYKVHYLDTTTLVKPINLQLPPDAATEEVYQCVYDFTSDDKEDLPFKKSERLYIIGKPEPEWWMARNMQGRVGLVPNNYLKKYVENSTAEAGDQYRHPADVMSASLQTPPFWVQVIRDKVPSPYDLTALPLKIDTLIKVTKKNLNGEWEGELDGRCGHFPFTHVKTLTND